MASEPQALLADGKLAGAWTLDGAKSSVGLRTKSIWGLVKVKGLFTQVTGEAVISAAGEATGTITVAAASIDTGSRSATTTFARPTSSTRPIPTSRSAPPRSPCRARAPPSPAR